MVNTNVTVLTTGGVGGAGRVDSDSVEGTEVATDTANLVFEDLVVETSLEFTLTSGGSSDIHSSLTTTKNHVFLLRRNSSAVEGSVGNIGLKDGEVTAGNELD